MMPNFDSEILTELQLLLEDEDYQTQVARIDPSDPATMTPAVKVTHASSGIEVICSKFDTQIQNKAYALVQLLFRLQGRKGI